MSRPNAGRTCIFPVSALFAGNEVGALLTSIVATCKLNDVDPVAYITKTLQAILDGYHQSRLEELMPPSV